MCVSQEQPAAPKLHQEQAAPTNLQDLPVDLKHILRSNIFRSVLLESSESDSDLDQTAEQRELALWDWHPGGLSIDSKGDVYVRCSDG